MPVTVNSTRLQHRLRALLSGLPIAADAGVRQAAIDATEFIQNAVRSQWADNNQVGFDLDHFINIIQRIEIIQGGYAILNTERMGTEQNFESTFRIKGLWHYGTGSGDKFGLFINQTGWLFDQVAEMVQKRQYFWGGTEPQWYLIEYGTTGSPGAYDPRPPTMTITNAAMSMAPRVWKAVDNAVTRYLRQRGVFA